VRKWRAQKQDIYIIDNLGNDEYLVSGSKSKDYRVHLNEPSCTCPDWQKRQPKGGCKHILHVKIEKGLINPVPSAKTNFGNPKYRAKSNYPSDWAELSKRTKERDNWICQKCGAQGGSHGNTRLEAHHMKPKSRGGKDVLNNLITICNSCHENEHGHAIPSGGGFNKNSFQGRSEDSIDNHFSASKSIDKKSQVSDRSKNKLAASQQSLSEDDNSEEEKGSKSLTSNSKSSTNDFREDEVKIGSWTSLQDMPKMLENEMTLTESVTGPLIVSGVLFGIFVLAGAILSVSILAWIGIIILSVAIYLCFQIISIGILIKFESMKDINKQLQPLVDELEENRGKPMEKRKVDRIHRLLEESSDLAPMLDSHITKEYVDWIEQSQEQLNYLKN